MLDGPTVVVAALVFVTGIAELVVVVHVVEFIFYSFYFSVIYLVVFIIILINYV